MHPAAGDVAVAGGATVSLRAATRISMILGLAMAAMAIFAATISPGNFHAGQAQVRFVHTQLLYLSPPAQTHDRP